MKKNIQVAIDGPASAGKSTVAKILAKKNGFIYCDHAEPATTGS